MADPSAHSIEQENGDLKPDGLSRRSMVTTLTLAMFTAVILATWAYSAVVFTAAWMAKNLFPVEPCMIIAATAAFVGGFGYFIQERWFPAPRKEHRS